MVGLQQRAGPDVHADVRPGSDSGITPTAGQVRVVHGL
jgi:hypothetical protein